MLHRLSQPHVMAKVHLALTAIWAIASVPIVVFFSESVPFLVFISVYAVVTGHWSAYQSVRVEEKQDETS